MSVYTQVEKEQLCDFLAAYNIGELVDFAGIADGIENTNYRIKTSHGDFLLTLFEHFSHAQIHPYLELISTLNKRNIPCPNVIGKRDGKRLSNLLNKPAAIFTFLSGESPNTPNLNQVSQIGRTLALLHDALKVETIETLDKFTPHDDVVATLKTRIIESSISDQQLFLEEFYYFNDFNRNELPGGYIHGDLFRDNCLFEKDRISAVLDFYSASKEAWILDLAIVASDWCRTTEGSLDRKKLDTLVNAYQEIRKLEHTEKAHWPKVLRFAAFRFWCSRLIDQLEPRDSILNVVKDPEDYKKLLIWIKEELKSFTL